MIGLILKLHVQPGNEQAVEDQMKILASECMRAGPGTLLYTLVKGEDGALRTMEIYESEEAVAGPRRDAPSCRQRHDSNSPDIGRGPKQVRGGASPDQGCKGGIGDNAKARVIWHLFDSHPC